MGVPRQLLECLLSGGPTTAEEACWVGVPRQLRECLLSGGPTASFRMPSWVGTEWVCRVRILKWAHWVGVHIFKRVVSWVGVPRHLRKLVEWGPHGSYESASWVGVLRPRSEWCHDSWGSFLVRRFEIMKLQFKGAKIRWWSRSLKIIYMYSSSSGEVRRLELNKYVQYVQRYCREGGAAGEQSAQCVVDVCSSLVLAWWWCNN